MINFKKNHDTVNVRVKELVVEVFLMIYISVETYLSLPPPKKPTANNM